MSFNAFVKIKSRLWEKIKLWEEFKQNFNFLIDQFGVLQ